MTSPDVGAALESALDQIPALAGPRVVVDLPGGLTNRNLRITTSTGDYVVRYSQSDAGLLGIDRDAEHHNTVAACRAGVGPEVIDYRPDLSMLVIGYLDATAYTNESFAHPGALAAVADSVRRLQEGPRFVNDFDMFTRRANYLRVVHEHGFFVPPDYEDHSADFARVEQALAERAEFTVPSNNDLLAGNILDDGARLWLIDYEYSGNNDRAFELGNTATECDLTVDQLDELTKHYLGFEDDTFRARVDLQALCSAYGWSLWGFIQAATSPMDFDFRGWGLERYEKALRVFTNDRFDDLLDRAAGR